MSIEQIIESEQAPMREQKLKDKVAYLTEQVELKDTMLADSDIEVGLLLDKITRSKALITATMPFFHEKVRGTKWTYDNDGQVIEPEYYIYSNLCELEKALL